MMAVLVYKMENGLPGINCQGCGQAAAITVRGQRVDARCYAHCSAQIALGSLDQEQIKREVSSFSSHSSQAPTDAGAEPWPDPLGPEALIGPAGEYIQLIEPTTEADPAAVLIQLLVGFGNLIGREPHVQVGAGRHGCNENALIVGVTAGGRKGTSLSEAQHLLAALDEEWFKTRWASGLSSGEGLAYALRDARYERREPENESEAAEADEDGLVSVLVDGGVEDKRLLVAETEFGQPLRTMRRDSNPLSPMLRSLWDNGRASTLVKRDPIRVTDGHLSVVGHVTDQELNAFVTDADIAGGLINRFLIVCARRSKFLPFPETGDPAHVAAISLEARKAAEQAKLIGQVEMTAEARELYAEVYPQLSTPPPGLLGAVTSRAEAHTLRLSLIYALLDRRQAIHAEHLQAALEVWRYCFQSAAYVFGQTTGDSLADRLLADIQAAGPEGLSRSEIRSKVGSNNVPADRIEAALRELAAQGKATATKDTSKPGRPVERWHPSTDGSLGGIGGNGRNPESATDAEVAR